MKNKKAINFIIIVLLAITLIWLLVVYKDIPDIIPTHWGLSGEPNDYGGKHTLFIMYAVMLGINILMPVIAKIDPRSDNYKRFEGAFNVFRLAITLFFMALLYISVHSATNEGESILSVDKFVPSLVGLLLIFIGNYMPKFKHNYTMGIKTPWTLADEGVWNKTHRIAGPIWIGGGVLVFFSRILFAPEISQIILIVSLVLLVVVPVVYSYVEYRKIHK